MVLDKLEKSRVNIKDLTLEEPHPESIVLFDPERDIHETGWKILIGVARDMVADRRRLELSGLTNDWGWLEVEELTWLKVLSPERFSAANLVDKDLEDSIFNDALRQREQNRMSDFTELAMYIKILFPERFDQLNMEGNWTALKSQFDRDRQHPVTWNFLTTAFFIRAVFPNRQSELSLDQEAGNTLLSFVDSLGQNGRLITRAYFKILFPQIVNNPNQEDQEMFNRRINWLNKGSINYAYLTLDAASMKILSADEVKMTDKGLEVAMVKPKPSYSETVQPLPEVRRF